MQFLQKRPELRLHVRVRHVLSAVEETVGRRVDIAENPKHRFFHLAVAGIAVVHDFDIKHTREQKPCTIDAP
mgnify:CR=1 FL=1